MLHTLIKNLIYLRYANGLQTKLPKILFPDKCDLLKHHQLITSRNAFYINRNILIDNLWVLYTYSDTNYIYVMNYDIDLTNLDTKNHMNTFNFLIDKKLATLLIGRKMSFMAYKCNVYVYYNDRFLNNISKHICIDKLIYEYLESIFLIENVNLLERIE